MHTLGHRAFHPWWWLCAASWLLCGGLYLTLPPSPDQFNHAYMGWRLLQGDVPYRDFIDSNWPGVMGLHAMAVGIFGVNLWSWRAFDMLLFAGTALFLADLARQAAGRNAGRLTLLVLPLLYVISGRLMAGQHDMSATQFMVAALWFHVRAYQRRQVWWQLGAGVFIAAAMLNKPTTGVIWLLFPLHALLLRVPVRTVLAHTVLAGLGVAAALFAAIAGVLWAGTSLTELVEATLTFNRQTQFLDAPVYKQQRTLDVLWVVTYLNLRGWWPLALGSLPLVAWLLRAGNRSLASTALPVLWLSGALSCLVQSRGFAYHLSPCMLALCAAMPLSMALVAGQRLQFARAPWANKAAIILFPLASIGLLNNLAFWYWPVAQAVSAGHYEQHLARFPANDGLDMAQSVAFARRLEALPPADCVMSIGTMSSTNFLARRHQGTRFYYFPVLVLAAPPVPMADKWAGLWEADLQAARCPVILIAAWVGNGWLSSPDRRAVALRQHLQAYHRTGTLGPSEGMAIYERN